MKVRIDGKEGCGFVYYVLMDNKRIGTIVFRASPPHGWIASLASDMTQRKVFKRRKSAVEQLVFWKTGKKIDFPEFSNVRDRSDEKPFVKAKKTGPKLVDPAPKVKDTLDPKEEDFELAWA